MIPYERHEKILATLEKETIVKIEDLHSKVPQISISTLRRDLKELEKNGKVTLLAGGAVKSTAQTMALSITTKKSLHSKEKQYIAEIASDIVEDGDVIYVDSGTTCTALLHELINRKVTIITTNPSVYGFSEQMKAEVIMLGGKLNSKISSLNGPLTDENIKMFYFNKSFLGANGIDVKRGVSTPNLVEATKKKTVIKQSEQSFLLCDSSKFHVNSAVKSFDIRDVTIISEKSDELILEKTKLIYQKNK